VAPAQDRHDVLRPAQLGSEDPTRKLYAEREAKIAEARAKKAQRG
jgi:hypothetical protein